MLRTRACRSVTASTVIDAVTPGQISSRKSVISRAV